MLVWPPGARQGDVPVAGSCCVSAAGEVRNSNCKLAAALRPLQRMLASEYAGSRFLALRTAWVRAMLRVEPSMRYDNMRGGWRAQFGFAQGVTHGKLDAFVGQAIAPKDLGGLVYPRKGPLHPLSLCVAHS